MIFVFFFHELEKRIGTDLLDFSPKKQQHFFRFFTIKRKEPPIRTNHLLFYQFKAYINFKKAVSNPDEWFFLRNLNLKLRSEIKILASRIPGTNLEIEICYQYCLCNVLI